MWGTSMGVGSGRCPVPHQVINGIESVVGVQQGRAELGHPITGLAVAIETDANAGAARRDGKSQRVLGPGGGAAAPHRFTHPISPPTPTPLVQPIVGKDVSSLAPLVATVTGRPHTPSPRDVIVMLM